MRRFAAILFCLFAVVPYAANFAREIDVDDREAEVAVAHIPGFIVIFTGEDDPEVLYLNVAQINAIAYDESGLGTDTILYLDDDSGLARVVIDGDAIAPEKIVAAVSEARTRAAEAGGRRRYGY